MPDEDETEKDEALSVEPVTGEQPEPSLRWPSHIDPRTLRHYIDENGVPVIEAPWLDGAAGGPQPGPGVYGPEQGGMRASFRLPYTTMLDFNDYGIRAVAGRDIDAQTGVEGSTVHMPRPDPEPEPRAIETWEVLDRRGGSHRVTCVATHIDDAGNLAFYASTGIISQVFGVGQWITTRRLGAEA